MHCTCGVLEHGISEPLPAPTPLPCARRFFATEGFYPNQSNVLRMLGYFSLIGLLRVHVLVGDYHSALKSEFQRGYRPLHLSIGIEKPDGVPDEACWGVFLLSAQALPTSSNPCYPPAGVYPINLNSSVNLYTTKVVGAHITLLYYGGFSYLMLGRYLDAGRVLNAALSYVNRVKAYYARHPQYDQVRGCMRRCVGAAGENQVVIRGKGGWIGDGGQRSVAIRVNQRGGDDGGEVA